VAAGRGDFHGVPFIPPNANKGWIFDMDPPDFDRRPSLRDGALFIATQALRAWLRSPCPSGTKAIRPSEGQDPV
jgi:hypothetical protein